MKHIALDIGREAERHNTRLEENENLFSHAIETVTWNIRKIGAMTKNKFGFNLYLICFGGLFAVLFFLFFIL